MPHYFLREDFEKLQAAIDEAGATISYRSPLAKMLIGSFEGEIRSGRINGEERCFKIVEVS